MLSLSTYNGASEGGAIEKLTGSYRMQCVLHWGRGKAPLDSIRRILNSFF